MTHQRHLRFIAAFVNAGIGLVLAVGIAAAEDAKQGRRGEDNHHGITAATLEKELRAAGFEILSAEAKNRAVMVVARRAPATPPTPTTRPTGS